jgi:effector-binding domain-containing protein
MNKYSLGAVDRRTFIRKSLKGVAFISLPAFLKMDSPAVWASDNAQDSTITHVFRNEILFAGIRKPIKKRAELNPRIEELKTACAGKTAGPLTHIMRFDTPVDGVDSEIGFPVSAEVKSGDIKTHTLRKMHFYSLLHEGSLDKLSETSGKLYQYMRRTGLSPELELVEIYHRYDPQNSQTQKIQVMASFLAWPEVYREQLVRVLGEDRAQKIWRGGEKITPHTLVDERCAWVAESIDRLKEGTNLEQQFDILSRVALIRPVEGIKQFKRMYEETRDINAIFQAKNEQLKKTPTGGFVDPPRFDGKILHASKVPYNGKKYMEAKTHREKRKAYCFCYLVREAENPRIDPIFCYRAAGWDRQFWEPILGVEFKKCRITHSILKGDDFCAWDFNLE